MTSFTDLLGAQLLGKDGEVDTETALSGKAAVALYFSGHWCPPCRGFTPQLAEWYTSNLKAKGLEVVFVSSDRDEAAFKEYYGEQPWLALPYSNREGKSELDKKFKVDGIPSVVILGPDGSVMTKDGRSAIAEDPTGEDIPWREKTFSEVFNDAKLIGSEGVEKKGSDLTGQVFGLYFSAHWCPPCRGFTPQLAEWYKNDLKTKGLEIVFVSSDRDEDAFKEYFAEQPWLALDYSDRKRKNQLSSAFKVQGIPSFVIIDKDGSVITKDGRAAVTKDPKGEQFPSGWYPKPVSNLSDGPGDINEITTVVAFCETCDASTKSAVEAAMEPMAKKYIAAAKEKGEDAPEVSFLIATEASGLAPRIRQMLQLEALPLPKHEHPLEKKEDAAGWGCDGCGASGAGKERWRCTQGCDFDFCGECNAKAGAESKTMPPKLMIVDIPDEGGYYEGPEGDVSTEVVEKLIADYQAKSLTRKQLG